jgi:hypothetical protein
MVNHVEILSIPPESALGISDYGKYNKFLESIFIYFVLIVLHIKHASNDNSVLLIPALIP